MHEQAEVVVVVVVGFGWLFLRMDWSFGVLFFSLGGTGKEIGKGGDFGRRGATGRAKHEGTTKHAGRQPGKLNVSRYVSESESATYLHFRGTRGRGRAGTEEAGGSSFGVCVSCPSFTVGQGSAARATWQLLNNFRCM
jgi:hypothetical protein